MLGRLHANPYFFATTGPWVGTLATPPSTDVEAERLADSSEVTHS